MKTTEADAVAGVLRDFELLTGKETLSPLDRLILAATMADKLRCQDMATKAKRPYVVVRTYSAGVHVGELVSRVGKEVELANARRVWSWQGANTLHEIASAGVGKGSKVSESVASIVLTEAIEILIATEAARTVIETAGWTK